MLTTLVLLAALRRPGAADPSPVVSFGAGVFFRVASDTLEGAELSAIVGNQLSLAVSAARPVDGTYNPIGSQLEAAARIFFTPTQSSFYVDLGFGRLSGNYEGQDYAEHTFRLELGYRAELGRHVAARLGLGTATKKTFFDERTPHTAYGLDLSLGLDWRW